MPSSEDPSPLLKLREEYLDNREWGLEIRGQNSEIISFD